MPGYAKERVSAFREYEKVTAYKAPGDERTFTISEDLPKIPIDRKEWFHTISAYRQL
jgi:hypothetical protein